MRITIHQPEHLPWLGLFHKIASVDTFVILDTVQFRKNYFQNRNKIRTKTGWSWITVPVSHSLHTPIRDVRIAESGIWAKKWWQAIWHAYAKAPFFDAYAVSFKKVIETKTKSLSELNSALIRAICQILGITSSIIPASSLDIDGSGSDLILQICKKLRAQEYLSGISGKEYLNLNDFSNNSIRVDFQEFHHPVYTQMHKPFLPCMSAIDLLFNHGDKSLDIIRGNGVPVMQEIFL